MRNVLEEIRLGGVWKYAPLQLYSLSLLRGDKGLGLMNLSNRLTTPGNENKNEHQCRSRKERSPRARRHAEGSREEPVWPSAQRRGISIGSHVLQRETLREGERPAQGPTDGSGEAGFNASPSGATGSSALSCRPPSGSSAEAIYSLAERPQLESQLPQKPVLKCHHFYPVLGLTASPLSTPPPAGRALSVP